MAIARRVEVEEVVSLSKKSFDRTMAVFFDIFLFRLNFFYLFQQSTNSYFYITIQKK